jgi:hypothetical protein
MARYMTLTEAAQRSRGRDGQQLSPVTLRVAIQRGRLSARKEGKTWMITEDSLRSYLANRPRWWKPTAASRR